MRAPEPVRRTAEIEEWSNRRLIHPVSAALVPLLARAGVAPNAVSLAGMGCGLLAGLAYCWWREPWCCVLGFALMLCWHVADGADGQLARLTGRQSASGKVLDGICDYVTFVAVYVALGISLARAEGAWVVALVSLAGICHAAQSAAYEARRERYDAFVHGRGETATGPSATTTTRRRILRDGLHGLYQRLQRAAGGDDPLRATWREALSRDPNRLPALRDEYRARFAPLVRRWSVLCANYRTAGIFLAAVSGHPLWYFGFEIVGFTAALLLLLGADRRTERGFMVLLRDTRPAALRRPSPPLPEIVAAG
ncbi:MAG: CDP-alcohol phosphatidyltransferase family protein [Gluconacetobacter diazotrophicus]|nr:CDP-alcohol phosphatidyltransferase family protein [Gluconacetobacter diazotrophicus]